MDSLISGNLTVITFFPIIGALIVLILSLGGSGNKHENMKLGALIISIVEFVLSLPLFLNFQKNYPGIQFEQNIPWIPDLGIHYYLGIDGISVFLVLLTTFIMPMVILSAWNAIHKGIREFLMLLFLLETAMIGTFCALDMILFFVFWEAVLIPMYFIIGIWGTERRVYAAIKFFIYTAFGSGLMFIAILFLYTNHVSQFGFASMNIFDLYNVQIPYAGILSAQGLLFLAFFLAFAIKVPMFPFHTWLPDAHVEAPTAGSVILAAVLLKMGTYGFLRFLMPLFPEATIDFLPILCGIAVVGVIYGALVAFSQTDLKKLVAYSSVSHLGLVMLGVFVLNVQGMQGGIYQMLNHGLSTGALFLIVGMIYERRHTKKIVEFGGIAKVMPMFALFFMIATLSSIGLPLLNGFVGEFLILLGAFKWDYRYSIFGATGIVLGAVYMLWAYQRVMFGPLKKAENKALFDLSKREIFVLLPLTIMMFVMGIYPKPFLERIEPSVNNLIQTKFYSVAKDSESNLLSLGNSFNSK